MFNDKGHEFLLFPLPSPAFSSVYTALFRGTCPLTQPLQSNTQNLCAPLFLTPSESECLTDGDPPTLKYTQQLTLLLN